MAKCPVCQNEVQASFGMIMCPKCQTPLFFDFDGNPQMGDSITDPPSAEPEFVETLEEKFIAEVSPSASDPHGDQPAYEVELNHSFKEEIQELALASLEESPVDDELNTNEQFEEISNQSESVEFRDHEFDLNISETIAEGAGQFLYEIEIDGIDGAKLRNELYEELKDPRWGWIAIELMGNIKMGKLVLKGINAVKASLLVNRLKGLPLEIKWKQNS